MNTLTEDQIEQIEKLAKLSYSRQKWAIRGQQLTPADNYDWHLIHAAVEFARAAAPAPAAQQATRETVADWFALAMGAAASLEDAAINHRDPDAKRAALGAAEHVRTKCNAMWLRDATAAQPVGFWDSGYAVEAPAAQQDDKRDAERYRWLKDHCGYSYAMASDSPAEVGISFGWTQRIPEESNWSVDQAIDAAIAAQKGG